jgi:osmotically-inducible protein OsmY
LSAINMLESTSSIPKGSIHVTAEDSVVTLRGDVTWDFERQAAESMIRRLHGVRSVINLVALKPKVSLTAVKAEIEAALRRRAYLDAQQIQVMVEGDTITLSGKVQNWAERNLALNSAWGTPGVRSVVDKMSFV